MDIHLTSRFRYHCAITENDISACITANHEKEVTSLRGKIADWFLGTQKEAAKLALFRLGRADTAAQQLALFAELKQYVSAAWQNLLTWQFDDNHGSCFKIGDSEIRCHDTTQEIVPENRSTVNPGDVCHLLLSMKYAGNDIVSEFHHFSVGSEPDRAADSVLSSENEFLKQNPALLGALKLIGLNQDDSQDDFPRAVYQHVKKWVYQITRDDDKSARAAGNARNLSILARLKSEA
ncbi:hypothetical protein [Morganella morganii]|uniref:hypothetical protein n=1 Tax=Morganella morganii TaxID=582 RepID=UPI00339CCCE3